MVEGKPVRIPYNAIYYILDCENKVNLKALLSDPDFQKAQAELTNIALSFGAQVKMSTNPKL